MKRFRSRHQRGLVVIEVVILVGTRRDWTARPESASPFWRATTLGGFVLATHVEIWDLANPQVERRASAAGFGPSRN